MTKGQKTDYEVLWDVMSSYFDTRNFNQTARDLNMPPETIRDLVNKHRDDDEFTKLRLEKESKFIEKANELIFKTINRMNKKLDSEDDIPLNQLSTALGTIYDKRELAQGGGTSNTPNVQINIVDNSNLERVLYEEDKSWNVK